jgi:hypothetical protein
MDNCLNVKLLLPPRQSRGTSLGGLEDGGSSSGAARLIPEAIFTDSHGLGVRASW